MSKLKLKKLLNESWLTGPNGKLSQYQDKLKLGKIYTDKDLPPFKTEKQSIDEELITEGTRWNVGMELPNGKVIAVYGHYDGYPQWVGKILKSNYSNPSKVKQLIKLGKNGISTLDKSMKGGKDHSFDSPKKGETVFYGRDRGEKNSMTMKFGSIDDFQEDFQQKYGAEYGYIWSVKEKKWYLFDYKGNKKEL